MRYITKVGDTHVIEYGGTNHSVVEAPVQYSNDKLAKFKIGNVTVNTDLTIYSINQDPHLAEIVLAVEVTRFIVQNKSSNS